MQTAPENGLSQTILATGFGIWGAHARNTSWDNLLAIRPVIPAGLSFKRRKIEVVWAKSRSAASELLHTTPKAIVAFGQCGDRSIRIETTATGRHSREKADATGAFCHEDATDDALRTSLDTQPIVDALASRQVPAYASLSAGDFLCNHFYYHLLRAAETSKSPTRILFAHVPQDGLVPDELIQEAMRLIIEHVASQT